MTIFVRQANAEVILPNDINELQVAIEALEAADLVKVSTKTAAYTIAANREHVLVNALSAAVIITLPTAVGKLGWVETIKKVDASTNAVTLRTFGSEKIDNALEYTITATNATVQVISDNANWWIVTPSGDPATPPSTAFVANYYVDPVNGLDTNTGSASAPWKTLTKAESVVSGTLVKVLVEPGTLTYTGVWALTKSGTLANPIIYKARVPRATTLFFTSATANGGKLEASGKNYRTFDGFVITQATKGTAIGDQLVKFDACAGITFLDCVIHNAYFALVRPVGCTDFLMDGCELYDVDYFAAFDCVRGVNIKLKNTIIHDYGHPTSAYGAVTVGAFVKGGVRGALMDNVEVYGNRAGASAGIILGGSSDVIYAWHPDGTTLADGSSTGFTGNEAYNVVAHNCRVQRVDGTWLYIGMGFQGSKDCAYVNCAYHGAGINTPGVNNSHPFVSEHNSGSVKGWKLVTGGVAANIPNTNGKVINCIVHTPDAYPYIEDQMTGGQWTNNLWYANGGAAAVTSAVGWTFAGNITGDPQWVDPANRDWHLRVTSVARDAGTVAALVDYNQAALPLNYDALYVSRTAPWDIGPYEDSRG